MNRALEFRVWNKPTSTMRYFELFSPLWRSLSADERNTLPECNEFMQFTGVLDKNGKGIYEGDIVEKFRSGRKVRCPVYWQKTPPRFIGVDNILDCEIVGNIYENPDLLN